MPGSRVRVPPLLLSNSSINRVPLPAWAIARYIAAYATGAAMTHAADVARWLGGKKLLKSEIRSDFDFVRLVQDGLPTAVLEALVKRGELTPQEVEKYIIPRRTLAHRKRRHQPLSREESDKLARVARIFAVALD